MNNDLPSNASVADDATAVSDDSNQVQPPASYAPTPEQGGYAPAPEQLETISPEVEEVLVTPEIPVSTQEPVIKEEIEEVAPVVAPTSGTPVPNVVDKRKHKGEEDTPLKTTQKLTEEADEEEADFIEHVEEIHSAN